MKYVKKAKRNDVKNAKCNDVTLRRYNEMAKVHEMMNTLNWINDTNTTKTLQVEIMYNKIVTNSICIHHLCSNIFPCSYIKRQNVLLF